MIPRTLTRGYGPRVGPKLAAGGVRIWTRYIAGRNFLFWASPTSLAVYAVTDDDQPNDLVHYWIKDT